MRTSTRIVGCLALLTVGYVLGASQIFSPGNLLAQAGKGKSKSGGDAQAAQPLTDETKSKIKAASEALRAAMEALQSEGRYETAVKGVNTFTVLTGGGNPLDDLKKAAVVDPETYAGLYCGLATDPVAVDLGKDIDGKLTYKGRVIRMYPRSILVNAYARRSELTGEDLLPTVADESAKSKEKKKTDEEEKPEEEKEE